MTDIKANTAKAILENKIIAIIRGYDTDTCLSIAESLRNGGIRLIEVTFNQADRASHKDTAAAIEAINRRFGEDVLAGAGTVVNREQLMLAADSGARYIISPNTNPEVIREAGKLGLVSMPGALTPTEILTAYENGADFVKLFPADSLAEDYIKAILAPINHVPLLAVGGVTENNVRRFLDLGFKGVGVGGSLTNKEWIRAGQFNKITALAKRFIESI